MKLNKAIFKAYDIRGLVPDELDEGVAAVIGKAFAEFLNDKSPGYSGKPIMVGHDMRTDSKSLAASVTEGLRSQGRNVVDIGLVASDMIYFAVGSLDAAGGLVVTASHSPGSYNGIKLCREQAKPVGIESGLAEVRDLAVAGNFPERKMGGYETRSIMDEWVEFALSFAKDIRPLKIAVDAGNGMAGAVIPHLEGKAPLEITPLYFELDGTFPNHEANPIKDETLSELKRVVVERGLDLGVAFDGDGDRMMLVDEKGQTVSSSITLSILAKHFLSKYPGSNILHNAICSRVVTETITKYGGTPVKTRVGHAFIKAAMRENDSPFGGEHSAHYFFRENWFADSGLIAALVAMGVLSESGLTLSELADDYRKAYVNSGEINFEVADKEAVIEKIAREFADGEQDRLDGISVNYEDWWFNVRPSNTEPLLRLNIEARTKQQLEKAMERVAPLLAAE